jgi:hypothetical protein
MLIVTVINCVRCNYIFSIVLLQTSLFLFFMVKSGPSYQFIKLAWKQNSVWKTQSFTVIFTFKAVCDGNKDFFIL